MRRLLPVLVLAGLSVNVSAEPPATLPFIQSFKEIATTSFNQTDPPESTTETYYDRDKGMFIRDTYSNGTYINHGSLGKSICYRLGRTKYTPGAGPQLTREWMAMFFSNPGLDLGSFTRDPDRDTALDGEKLLAYFCHFPKDGDYYEWIDSRGFRRREEIDTPSTEYARGSTILIDRQLNPPVPDTLWQDPPDLKHADLYTEIGKAFPLQTALFTREIDGNTLAVHYLSKNEDGDFFIITTWRLSPETAKKVEGTLTGGATPSLHSFDPATNIANNEWRDISFATILADGISVQFHFIVPRVPDPAIAHAQFAFSYNAPAIFPTTTLPAKPAPSIDIPFDLKVETPPETISDFAAKTFDALDPYDDNVQRIRLDLGTSDSKRPRSAFASWTRDEFVKQLPRYLALHQHLQMEARVPEPRLDPLP